LQLLLLLSLAGDLFLGIHLMHTVKLLLLQLLLLVEVH